MKDFFAPEDFINYPPCGMYSLTHIIATIICFIFIVLFCIKCKNIGKEKVIKLIRIVAIVVTLLELIKIGYNFYYGYYELIHWFPLSFCSLFIFTCYFAGYGKNKIQKLGLSFLTGGCIVAGTTFLLMPTTSLTLHPMFHYLSCYSMLFHSLMIFIGVTTYLNGLIEVDKENYKYYFIFTILFLFIAFILNLIFDENLMFIMYPLNIPVKILHTIANKALPVYIIGASLVYLIIPYLVSYLVCNKILKNYKSH